MHPRSAESLAANHAVSHWRAQPWPPGPDHEPVGSPARLRKNRRIRPED